MRLLVRQMGKWRLLDMRRMGSMRLIVERCIVRREALVHWLMLDSSRSVRRHVFTLVLVLNGIGRRSLRMLRLLLLIVRRRLMVHVSRVLRGRGDTRRGRRRIVIVIVLSVVSLTKACVLETGTRTSVLRPCG
jgi:hypothetical protein